MSVAPATVFTLAASLWTFGRAASAQAPGPEVVPFVAINEPVVLLRHVRVIDGTGSAARDDQSIVIANGRITAVGPAASTPEPAGAKALDYAGYTA